ncbi:MAG: disulfide reductase, partial [Treponemataceae bacterium]|nr:disulfide reductase [Treponemataceae bacterium]
MTYSYYPGCTLKTKGKDLDRYGRFAAEKLGVTLKEIADWQCCGGAYTMARDEIASKLSAVRTLASARDEGNDVVTLCSACHNVLKQVNNDMKVDENINLKANNYLALEKPYNGETNVIHFLELLRDVVGFDKIAASVTKPFTGKKIGAYYGCLLL